MQILQTLSAMVKNISIEPLIRVWKFILKIASQSEDVSNMLTELPQSEVYKGTAVEALILVKSR